MRIQVNDTKTHEKRLFKIIDETPLDTFDGHTEFAQLSVDQKLRMVI